MPNPQPSNPQVSYQIAGAGISTINQYGLGDNISGDKVMGDKIVGNKVVTSTQTQAIAQALQDLFKCCKIWESMREPNSCCKKRWPRLSATSVLIIPLQLGVITICLRCYKI